MLVSIPWQPELKLHPDTLTLLIAASKRVGRNLYLYNSDSAWRSYARQKALWLASQSGGNPASNPDSGQRSHMRGAAVDLRDTSTAVQAACVAVGLKRDPAEAWHWNHPNWAAMPIIPADIPAPTEEDDDMAVKVFKRTEGTFEGMRVAPYLKGGFEVTEDAGVFLAWERIHAAGSNSADQVNRAGYIAIQSAAASEHTQYVASQGSSSSASLPATITGQFTATL